MNTKKTTIISIAAICCVLTLSCTDSILNGPADSPDESSVTKSSSGVPLAQNSTPMVLGEKLNNPYALDVMQAAVKSLTQSPGPGHSPTQAIRRFPLLPLKHYNNHCFQSAIHEKNIQTFSHHRRHCNT